MYFAERTLYAHTLDGRDETDWERLSAHLDAVALDAGQYAGAFGAAEWGGVLGQCHDLGKASAEFQAKLHAANPKDSEDAGVEEQATAANHRVDHSTFGARYVSDKCGGLAGEMLAYCIAGHHAGLPNGRITEDVTSGSTLEARIDAKRTHLPHVDDPGLFLVRPQLPFRPSGTDMSFALAFFTRMLFSCLIDADRTCTEAFCDPVQALERRIPRPSIAALREQLDAHMTSLQRSAAVADGQCAAQPNLVNSMRRHVLAECQAAATMERGFFSLQVPTGGGKTLASLVFALHHAQRWEGRRVVVAIPFTSIIEQTADVYRGALGGLADTGMVEHHSDLQPQRDTRSNQLGTENWDAPLVVTTNVQLFESLFAMATTPCRKLHRLANSVIILDEAQILPVDLLAPTLAALRELVANYKCTVVLCTATQPALEKRDEFPMGLSNVRPMVSDAATLYTALRRVEVRDAGKLDDDVLVQRLAAEERVLAIVNTRAHAAKLFREMVRVAGSEGCFHLSTRMCGAHRRNVLKRVREAALTGPCRIVSTQLIEAGVDLDLPVVYRAEAGFDSIAQAAGRCNREGRLPELGITYLFQAQDPPPPGYLRDTAATARELLPGFRADPLSPIAIEAYFRQHYWKWSDRLDERGVLPLMSMQGLNSKFQFRDIAHQYKIIRDEQVPILVPYGEEGKNLLDVLQSADLSFIPHRKLQPFLVSVPRYALHVMEKQHAVREHESGVWLLLSPDAYNNAQGLMLDNLGVDGRAVFG
jgi:CRISPR-associated endonuclease/helicase Cas3